MGVIDITYVEYSLFKQCHRILRGIEKSGISRVFRNIFSLLQLLVTKDRNVLIGLAPNNLSISLIKRLKKNHTCLFTSSWPYWDGARLVEAEIPVLPSQEGAWHRLIDGSLSVGITEAVCTAMAKHGATTFYIPHTVDTEHFCPDSSRRSSDTVRILFAGCLLKLKGVHLLLNVIKGQEWRNVEFWFVGRGKYEREIRNMQQQGHPIRYFGHISSKGDMVSIYQQSDIFVLPTMRIGVNEEKFGIVLIEAMACQLPVITTDCIGPKQVVEHGRTGIIIPQNDERALRDAIDKMVKSSQLRSELGKNGREKAERIYDMKLNAERWLEVMKKVYHA
ncbi:glycosyltransferase family 4 protein [Planctomycetota bacterium]